MIARPGPAILRHKAAPIPEPPPVTTVTIPSNFVLIAIPYGLSVTSDCRSTGILPSADDNGGNSDPDRQRSPPYEKTERQVPCQQADVTQIDLKGLWERKNAGHRCGERALSDRADTHHGYALANTEQKQQVSYCRVDNERLRPSRGERHRGCNLHEQREDMQRYDPAH